MAPGRGSAVAMGLLPLLLPPRPQRGRRGRHLRRGRQPRLDLQHRRVAQREAL
ncbi:hypothetical protein B296_00017410 [Ensete ventricosum]|uniref:Uncharacterized protein n=1 Tax=Ensete ventricosum TaxID=4639 RepID=A0A427B4Y2_ENSVE|nr:hypothetical protein B296_00017410 [Ensete ventricosum]